MGAGCHVNIRLPWWWCPCLWYTTLCLLYYKLILYFPAYILLLSNQPTVTCTNLLYIWSCMIKLSFAYICICCPSYTRSAFPQSWRHEYVNELRWIKLYVTNTYTLHNYLTVFRMEKIQKSTNCIWVVLSSSHWMRIR